MRRLFFLIVMLTSSVGAFSQRYLFYLHGRIVEDQGPNGVDTIRGFGPYRYQAIVDSLRKRNFVVIARCDKKIRMWSNMRLRSKHKLIVCYTPEYFRVV